MIGPERLAAGERAEMAGDYIIAAAAYRDVTGVQDEALAAHAYYCLGRVSLRQSRFDPAIQAFESSIALGTRLGDFELVARVENAMGVVYYMRGEHDIARRLYSASLARTSDAATRGKIILNFGILDNIESRFVSARDRYEEAYRLFTESGDLASATLALHNRGMVEADLGMWQEADASFLEALRLATEADNREIIAKTLVNRSEVLLEREDFAQALSHCDRALDIYAVVGDEVGRGEALKWKARALSGMNDLVLAERFASEALHIAMRSGARLLEAEASRDVGVLRGLLGDRAGGVKQLQRALVLFNELEATKEAGEVAALIKRPTPARSLTRIGAPDGTAQNE